MTAPVPIAAALGIGRGEPVEILGPLARKTAARGPEPVALDAAGGQVGVGEEPRDAPVAVQEGM